MTSYFFAGHNIKTRPHPRLVTQCVNRVTDTQHNVLIEQLTNRHTAQCVIGVTDKQTHSTMCYWSN